MEIFGNGIAQLGISLMKRLLTLLALIASMIHSPAPTRDNRYDTNADNTQIITATAVQSDMVLSVEQFGATGDGVTDNTTAIQNAVNFAISNLNNNVTIQFSNGTYVISGALQDTTHANSQIIIPPTKNSYSSGQRVIKFKGQNMPAQGMYILATGGQDPGGTILKSTINGSGGSSAVFSTYNAAGASPGFNALQMEFENLTVRVVPGAAMSGINGRNAFGMRVTGVQVYNGLAPFESPQPTNATSVGIMTPTNNNGAFTRLQDCSSSGFYTGYEMNEHAIGNNLSSWACIQAYTFPFGYHAVYCGRIMSVHCQNGLVWTGISRAVIDEFDVEHAATADWKTSVWDATDGNSGNGIGSIVWAAVLQNVGIDHTFNVSGTNICSKEVGATNCIPGMSSFSQTIPPVQVGYPLLVSWDADGVTNVSTGTAVSYVPDQGTNGWHLTQTAAGLRPTITFSAQNGHKAVTFADPSFLTNLVYSRAQPHEIFATLKISPTSHTFFNTMVDGSAEPHRNLFQETSSSGNGDHYAGTEVFGGSPFPESKFIVIDAVFNGASSVLYTNGVQFISGNVGAEDQQGFWLMALNSYVGNNGGHTTVGNVLRVDTYQTNFPAGSFSVQRSNIYCWITNRYNLAP